MELFELIKRCLDSGYELSFKKELGNIFIEVFSKDIGYDEGSKEALKYKCSQIIPNDDHIYKLNEVILFCIDKVDELRAQHRKLLKQGDGRAEK